MSPINTLVFSTCLSLLALGCGGGGTKPPPIQVAVTPAAVTLKVGEGQDFKAEVTGTANKEVRWSVVEADGGTFPFATMESVYMPPWSPGTFHVRATSRQDSTAFGEATITVVAAPAAPPDESRAPKN